MIKYIITKYISFNCAKSYKNMIELKNNYYPNNI